MAEMTKALLKKAAKDNGGYTTPELNDKLFLNFHGFHRLENLEEYRGLRAIFLEGNCLDSLEGLPELPELRCLYVQQNCIREISHAAGVRNLDTLNISHNRLKRVDNLDQLPMLTNINLAHNFIGTKEDIAGLLQCPTLSVIHLSNNKIEDPDCLEIFKKMPNLRCLYLQGNPIVSNTRHYRKSLIASIKTLSYLDDRPVFELERLCAEAWAEGGLEAERAARAKYKEDQEARDRRNFEAMLEIKKEAWRLKRERLGLPPGDTDPDMDDISSGSVSDEDEPPELVEARRRLAQYSARPGEEEPVDLTEARRDLARRGVPIAEGRWGEGDVDEGGLGPDRSATSTVANGAHEVDPNESLLGALRELGQAAGLGTSAEPRDTVDGVGEEERKAEKDPHAGARPPTDELDGMD